MAIFLGIILLFGFPFFTLALGLKSLVIFILGLAVGFFAYGFYRWSAFSEFLLDQRALVADEVLQERFQKLWVESGPAKIQARFWVYPSSDAQFKVWVQNKNKVDVFFSLGLVQIATDAGLRAAFQSIQAPALSDIKLQNRRYALNRKFERWKGPEVEFRYWFVSFWLYPLERFLKIAKI